MTVQDFLYQSFVVQPIVGSTHICPGFERRNVENLDVWVRVSRPQHTVKTVVVIFHGNAGNLDYHTSIAKTIASRHDAHVVTFDYTGFGQSVADRHHIVSRKQHEADSVRVVQWVQEQFPDQQMILFGHSLGGYYASYAFAHCNSWMRKFDCLVLVNAFATIHKIFPAMEWLAGAVIDDFSVPRNLERLSNGCVYLFHSRFDNLISAETHPALNWEAVPAMCKRSIEIFSLGDHNDMPWATLVDKVLATTKRRR